MQTVWGEEHKAQDDPTTISEEILASVGAHNADPDAHLEDGQSLKSHRASEIIDHVARSIVNDKVIEVARAYTAIMQVPTTYTENLFWGAFTDFDGPVECIPSDKTVAEILSRGVTADDSEYVIEKYNDYGDNYFSTGGLVVPTGKKIYKVKIKWRAKIVEPTVATLSCDLAYGDGWTYGFIATTAWQNFEYEMYFGQNNDDEWLAFIEAVLNSGYFCINIGQPTGDKTKNWLAISQFYCEAQIVDDIFNEDFFDLKSAVDYVNSLGGGSVYIKNGTYNTGLTKTALNSYVEIIGESLAGVILNCSSPDYNLLIGSDASPEYTAGTITLTQNSASVVASGVTWTSAKTVGKYLLNKASGHYYKIVSWQDSTHITIDTLYQGQTTSSLTYLIIAMKQECKISNVTLNFELIFNGAINTTLDNVKIKSGYLYYGYLENLQVINCDLENILSTSQYDYVSNSKWINNTFKNYTTTCFWGKITCVGNIFEDNLFLDCKGQCLILYGYHTLIKGNIILNCGWTSGSLYSPIILGSTSKYLTVVQNTVRLCATYGIGSQTGANYNIVAENIVVNNGDAGVVNVGANSVTASNIV